MPELEARQAGGPQNPRAAFTHSMTHPLVLDLLLIKKLGPSYLEWDPATLWREIALTWDTTISTQNRSRIQAVRTTHTSDQSFEAWEIFEKVALGLLGSSPRFDVVQRLTPTQAMFALAAMRKIRNTPAFSSEVIRYCAAVCMDHGVAWAPAPMSECNKYIGRYVDRDVQVKVRDAVERGYEPTFDGRHDEDVQVLKSQTLVKFLAATNAALLNQLKTVVG